MTVRPEADGRREVVIGDRRIGPGRPCFIVAEPGSNHDGRLDTALELIDAAAEAGADAIKFQTFRAEDHYTRDAPSFSYLDGIAKGKTTFELIKENELPRQWHAILRRRADERGIMFWSTPSDRAAVNELVDMHAMPAIKIASFEAVDLPFIAYCARKGRPLVVSTGMCDLGDIEDVLRTAHAAGNDDVILLHCTSLYPTRHDQVNLLAMRTIAQSFGRPVGLSDHSLGISVPIAAAALGAVMIEKHITLDRSGSGPDHSFALEPDELRAMVRSIREVELALGSAEKRMIPEEAEMARLGRRSLVAACAIPEGTVITADMLTAKRPGSGIRPKYLDIVVGRRSQRDIAADEVITWDMV